MLDTLKAVWLSLQSNTATSALRLVLRMCCVVLVGVLARGANGSECSQVVSTAPSPTRGFRYFDRGEAERRNLFIRQMGERWVMLGGVSGM